MAGYFRMRRKNAQSLWNSLELIFFGTGGTKLRVCSRYKKELRPGI